MILLRLLWPDAMVTEECGTFKSFAKNSMDGKCDAGWTGVNSDHQPTRICLFRQRSLCPHARRSSPLQLQLRSRATCPWKSHPCLHAAVLEPRSDHVVREACENMAAPAENLRRRAGWSSAHEIPGFPTLEQRAEVPQVHVILS